MMVPGTQLNSAAPETVSVKKSKGGLHAAIGIIGFGVIGLFAAVFMGLGRSDNDSEDVNEGKTPREVADDEKRKLTPQEMGRRGAQKRWAKKKAEQETEGEKEDENSSDE